MEINEKRVYQQIRSFQKALDGYSYNEPLSRYLTRFFKENKQMGSSDRRMTSRFCYNYFRLGNSIKNLNTTDRLVFAEYLCTADSGVVKVLKPELFDTITSSISFKIDYLIKNYRFELDEVFPLVDHLSINKSKESFLKSQFIQPDLFIRIRRGKETIVRSAFDKEGIIYESISNNCLRLANGINLQKVSRLEGCYEVQDLSSQHTLEFIDAKPEESWWDSCTASGGKALLFLDKFPKTNLLVSDIRLSILRNLDERFENAEIKAPYRKKILDLSKSVDSQMSGELFDGIIVDAPCSGSGTWGRTPEMIQQFNINKLNSFSVLQQSILTNVLPYLKENGQLLYITCSVYKEENEDNVKFLLNNFNLELVKMSLIKGYQDKADSMFVARFIKKL